MPFLATLGVGAIGAYRAFRRVEVVVDTNNYIEDVFSTYLYTGNEAAQTITNGINLSEKGGLVWLKNRSVTGYNVLFDTQRSSFNNYLITSSGLSEQTGSYSMTALSDGFSFNSAYGAMNGNGNNLLSWTFRKQEKFFDIVTYTGTGVARTVPHNLGSVPGCIIVKKLNDSEDWQVYHRSVGNLKYLVLNSSSPEASDGGRWNNTTPNTTTFTVGTSATVNANGFSYIAYLFAHDAGGFGADGTANVVSCGTYTGNGLTAGQTIEVGFEPQWLLIKAIDPSTGKNWYIWDNNRGIGPGLDTSMSNQPSIVPNSDAAEALSVRVGVTSTGFAIADSSVAVNENTTRYLYVAIRRGPMKTPTSGTQVFSPTIYTEQVTQGYNLSSGFVTDAVFHARRNSATGFYFTPRLTTKYLTPTSTAVEGSNDLYWDRSNGIGINSLFNNSPGATNIVEQFRRAPGFFDVVCYNGTGSATTKSHNLGVVPEMMIVKSRTGTVGTWPVYHSATGATSWTVLNTTAGVSTTSDYWNNTTPTSTVFSIGDNVNVNGNTYKYIAYLFATCPGVSKVGSYTGTGTTLSIDCGFTTGARFILLKRTDTTGNWFVWDSARGIISGDDPYLLMNSTAAEVGSTDHIDPLNSGFQITSTAPAEINGNGGSFIFLAIA